MSIATIKQNGTTLEITLEGRLDTVTAPELEKMIAPIANQFDTLVYDFEKVDYISSAGLRVLLIAHRGMCVGGKKMLLNCNSIVKKVLEVTGFEEIAEIE